MSGLGDNCDLWAAAAGPPPKVPLKWKRELRLLRRDGLVKYVRLAYKLRRFHRSVRRMERQS